MSTALELLQQLIRLPSITPDDAGCQKLIASRLKPLGFSCENLTFGDVTNLWAKRGNTEPLLVFAGHTDVVPPGPIEEWDTPPFEPIIKDGFLYGRGTADMKGSLAAIIVACEKFIKRHPHHAGSIAFLLTSDEEGHAIDGTRKVIEHLYPPDLKEPGIKTQNEKITWCVVGEPSSEKHVGDTIKIGRRGSLNGKLIIHGKQGHIAYPHLAENPIHSCLAVLSALCKETWGNKHEDFPHTAFQISNIHAGVGTTNVIPSTIEIVFNFRYSPNATIEELKQKVSKILAQYNLKHDLVWSHSGEPFLTPAGKLRVSAQAAIKKVTGLTPILSTDGGTSDGRFIAPLGCEVLELGPCNATIHQANECISVDELNLLTQIYEQLLVELFL